ncbi:phage protein [Clostridium baratii]|uniref:hypothetical protein n=1 Tax=Clostridium baratii TaxID=1561 RepID=UPI0006BEF563|nr:hypothetical protein [Clostridium baratii]CUP06529.1 phage protein [Clostridium baratii]
MAGWQKVYRDITKHWLWEDKPFSRGQAFIDLLLMVNHQDKKILFNGDLIEVKRGSRITSLRQLGESWGWSRTKVKKFLEQLEKDGMITVKSDSKKTVVNIENYSVYQDSKNSDVTVKSHENDSGMTEKDHIDDTGMTLKDTNKNDKEYIKKDNKEKEGEESKEGSPKTEHLNFPTQIYKNIYNLVGEVGYKTWFKDAKIEDDDKSVSIKVNTDLQRNVITKTYIPRLQLEFNKRIEVS